MLLYFLITKLYCALLALWKSRRISSQMKQYTDMSHCQYMLGSAILRVASLRVYGGDLLPRKRSLKCNFVCFDELTLYFIL